MNQRGIFVLYLLFILSIYHVNAQQAHDPSITSNLISTSQIFEDTLSILESRIASKSLISYSDDPGVIYYSSTGLAGIGLNLLQAAKEDTAWISSNIQTRLISLASDLADYLISLATLDNGSHAIWSVSNKDTDIDLSLEFGLAGIVQFFIALYNVTEINSYSSYATKTLNTISDMVEGGSDDLYFSFNTTKPIDNSWYPIHAFSYYNTPSQVFTGVGYGTAGIARMAMEYLRDVNSSNTALGNALLTRSLHWLWSQREQNGTELAFHTTSNNSSLLTTNRVGGMAGIGDLYLDLYEFTSNTTYLDAAWGIAQWFNGTLDGEERTDYTWQFNGLIDQVVELGVHNGIGGIIEFLDHFYDFNATTAMRNIVTTNTNALRFYALETSGTVEFPEQEVGGVRVNMGSTSLAFGGGGISILVHKIGTKYNLSSNIEYASKMKAYLTSAVESVSGNYAIFDIQTGIPETNPMRGMSGSLVYLSAPSKGILNVDTTVLEFGTILVGGSRVLSFTMSNTGDSSIEVQITKENTPFSHETGNITINAGSIYILNVTFSPQAEGTYSHSIQLKDQVSEFTITMQGAAYDVPSIVYEGPENNTIFSAIKTHSFKITANDPSGIDNVQMAIRNENETLITSFQMSRGGNVFTGDWDTTYYPNGTYIIDFVATDVLGNSNSQRYVFRIGVYTTPVEERVFSTEALIALILTIAVLIILVVMITRRFRQ